MTDPEADAIVANYFRRLENVLSDIPQDRRDQLVEELRDHVSQARAALAVESTAAIHEILERIGSPEEIAAEESNDDSGPSGIVAYFLRRKPASGQRPPVSDKAWRVIGAVAGYLFVLAFLIGELIVPSAPNIDADTDTVTNYVNANVHSLLASGLLGTSAALIFLVFLGAVHRLYLRANGDHAVSAGILLAAGTVFAAVGALGSVFMTTLAILAGQSVGNLESAPYVPAAFVLHVVVGTGVFGLAAAILLGVLGFGMVSARLVGRWFGLLCLVLAVCNAAGGGAALILGSYNQFWMVVQTVGMFGVAFAVLSASASMLVDALGASAPLRAATEIDVVDRQRALPAVFRFSLLRSNIVAFAVLGAIVVAASIAVPLATRGSRSSDLASGSTFSGAPSAGSTSSSASVGYDGSAICAPTTDAATSGGSPAALMSSATKVASGTIEGKSWSLWSANGQSGASGLEDGGVVFDGHEYGLCPGYPNPSETEMIATGGDAIIYGVVNYPGLAQVQVSTGAINSFAVGAVLPSPRVEVVNGVSFYIGALPQPACSYSYFEINTTSPSYSAQHNIGFGGDGAGQGYSITNNPGNDEACVSGKLDPLSYSEGAWQLSPGQFSPNG